MRSRIPGFIVMLIAMVLQAGLAPYITILGVTPNILLLAVVSVALSSGPDEGALAGFVGGLLFDLLGTGPVGVMALVLTLTGFLAGLLHSELFAEGWLLPLTVLAVAALSSEVAYGLLIRMFGEGFPFWRAFLTKMLPGAAYDTVLALLVFPWSSRFLRPSQSIKTFTRLT